MSIFDDIIDQAAEKFSFSGVVSVTRYDEPLYARAFGFRNDREQLPNGVDTRFGIASGTKAFTALGIALLQQQGRLRFNTPIAEIDKTFHSFIHPEATIGQLLDHTSGVYDYYDEEIITDFDEFQVEIPWYALKTPSDYLPLFLGKPMKHEPGQRFAYSNGGYILLGIVIERLTGMTYQEFIQDEVLIPLGMNASGFFAFDELPSNTALGYLEGGNQLNIFKLPIIGSSDGGMYTTAEDLLRFWQGLFTQRVIQRNLADRLTDGHIKIHDHTQYGYGFYRARVGGQWYHAIVGCDAGVGFDSRYLPEQDLVISVLSNRSYGEAKLKRVIFDHISESFEF